MLRLSFFILSFLSVLIVFGQQEDSIKIVRDIRDSIYIKEIEDHPEIDKVLHAEPLFTDLIRDLGARKGEKEWNVGLGLMDNNKYVEYEALVEYEWAPINRLGLEIELPFSFYAPVGSDTPVDSIPRSTLQSLKLAAQWTFLVNSKLKTSLAIGYLHEFESIPFVDYGNRNVYKGNIFNPFFIGAKRWGQNFHTLIYTGPQITQEFSTSEMGFNWEMNTNFHYMIDGTRNFIGVEVNKYFSKEEASVVLRPQMRVSMADNLMIGIVVGIPVTNTGERLSTFLRLIYEPGTIHK